MSKATPENDVKREIKKYLESIGAQYWQFVPSGYGKSAVDFLCCIRGKYVAIEAKRKGVYEPTPRQAEFLKSVTDAGGLAFTTDSVERVQKMIEDHILGAYRDSLQRHND